MANVDGTPFVGIASFGFDSDANRIANEAKLVKGNAVYLYAALRALAAWKPAHFTVTVDGERHELSGYSVAVGNSKAYGGGMYRPPRRPSSTTASSTCSSPKDTSKLDLPARACSRSSRAPTSTRPTRSSCAAR